MLLRKNIIKISMFLGQQACHSLYEWILMPSSGCEMK